MLDKRGFLFTVTIFLVLTYILLSISVWVKSVEASEQSYSEFYKESTVELAIDQITPAKLDNVTYVIMNRELSRLNDNVFMADDSVQPGPPGDENQNIREAMRELFMYGNASPDYFTNGGIETESNSSFTAWASDLNDSLNSIGVYMDRFNVTNFNISQSGIDKVDYSFDLTLGMRDYTNTTSVSRTYHISDSVGISGFVDPALAEASKNKAGDAETIYRQFFFDENDYPSSNLISVTKLTTGVSEGQGWLYDPLVHASIAQTAIPQSEHQDYILVGTYNDINSLGPDVYDTFAGYILTTAPVLSPTCTDSTTHQVYDSESYTFNPIIYTPEQVSKDKVICVVGTGGPSTQKPFIVAPGFDPGSAPACPILDGSNARGNCMLFQNDHQINEVQGNVLLKADASSGLSGLYNLEKVRDFTMCGYYTQNPDAPSYLQRLLSDPYSKKDANLGIETFVIGNYANDSNVYGPNGNGVSSRLDTELFDTSVKGIKIRGLPGCKSYDTCADNPQTGIFAISNTGETDYGLANIACDNGEAGCG